MPSNKKPPYKNPDVTLEGHPRIGKRYAVIEGLKHKDMTTAETMSGIKDISADYWKKRKERMKNKGFEMPPHSKAT